MSKAHMVVLSFLKAKPFHGYQIGQMVEQMKLPRWAGITLPAIYKAMQNLEKNKHIHGEEMREGNNPPRMVYHLDAKGRAYLEQIINGYLANLETIDKDWWLALHFAENCLSKQELLGDIEARIERLKEIEKTKALHTQCAIDQFGDKLPFVHAHVLALGTRYIRSEMLSLQELKNDILGGTHDEFFKPDKEAK